MQEIVVEKRLHEEHVSVMIRFLTDISFDMAWKVGSRGQKYSQLTVDEIRNVSKLQNMFWALGNMSMLFRELSEAQDR